MSRKTTKPAESTEVIEAVELVVPTVVDEVPAEVIEKENRIVDLESEVVRLQDRIKDIRKELRGLEGKTKREGPTKMDVCRDLYKMNGGLQRKEYVQMFMEKAELSTAAAKTNAQIIISNANKAAEK